MRQWKRYIPLVIILVIMAVGFFSGFYQAIDFETLRYHHNELTEYVNNKPILTPFLFMGIYAAATALSIPGGLFLSLLGGFLFPQPWCTLYVVIGATTGACMLFLAAKTAFGDSLKKKAGPRLKKMEKGFEKNAGNYLLFLRFVPLFPFWLVNIAPAFFNVPFWTYFWTTLIGISPGAFVFTHAGRGLNAVFEQPDGFSLENIFNLQVKIALVGLGLFALLPILIKKIREKKNDRH
ncbi:MAG: hypothetical protein KR126chlam1_00197 [Chlamydiae bacterium]|nr:hypothetical protein [Chlamydiota bacterium]